MHEHPYQLVAQVTLSLRQVPGSEPFVIPHIDHHGPHGRLCVNIRYFSRLFNLCLLACVKRKFDKRGLARLFDYLSYA